MYLKNKEASVEDTRVDENCTKLTTLEELVRLLKEEVVGIQHHHPIVVYQAPCVQFVQCQLEPSIEVRLVSIWVVYIIYAHYFCSILVFPAIATLIIIQTNKTLFSTILSWKSLHLTKKTYKLKKLDKFKYSNPTKIAESILTITNLIYPSTYKSICN